MSRSPVFGLLDLHEPHSNLQLDPNLSRREAGGEFFIPRTPSPSPEPLPPPLEIPNFYFDDIEVTSPTKKRKSLHSETIRETADSANKTSFYNDLEVKNTPVSKYIYKDMEKKPSTQNPEFVHSFGSTTSKTPKLVTKTSAPLSSKNGSQKTPRHIAVSALLNAVRSPQSRPPQNFEEISATSSDEESSLAEYAKDRLVSPAKTRKKKPGIVFQSPTRLPLQMGTQTRNTPSKKSAGNMYRSPLTIASPLTPNQTAKERKSRKASKQPIQSNLSPG